MSHSSLKNIYESVAKDALNNLIKKAKSLSDKWLADQNAELKQSKPGDTVLLGKFTVVTHVGNRLLLEFRTATVQAGIGFARIRFEMNDQIAEGNAEISIKSLTVEASLTNPKITIGGGADWSITPAYEVFRAVIDLEFPPIHVDAFFAASDSGGFIIDFKDDDFSVMIPLADSGFALRGFGGTLAHKFAPRLRVGSDDDPDALDSSSPGSVQADTYLQWANRMRDQPLDAWIPVMSGRRSWDGVGLRTDIIDLLSCGFVVTVADAGFLALSNGPIIILGGDAKLFDLGRETFFVRVLAVLDFASFSLAGSGAASLALPSRTSSWKVLEASGSISALLPIKHAKSWYQNIGTDSAPISGHFLADVLSASVYFMLNNDRALAGADVKFGGDLSLLGIAISAHFGMSGQTLLGWNPGHFSQQMALYGGVSLKVWKFEIGIDLNGRLLIEIPHPFHLVLQAGYSLKLGWFGSISGTIKIFDYADPAVPDILPPLLTHPTGALGGHFTPHANISQIVGAVHAISGRQWNIERDNSPIWPDSEIVLPFLRRLREVPAAGASSKIINSTSEIYSEGGVKVAHSLTNLHLFHLADGQAPVEVDMRGVWVEGPPALDKTSTPVAALHVPGADPFEWLSPHVHLDSETTIEPAQLVEQGFLVGPNEIRVVVPKRFGDVVVDATLELPIELVSIAPETFGSRLLIGRQLNVALSHVGSEAGSQPMPIEVARIELLVPSDYAPKLIVPSGFDVHVAVSSSLDEVAEKLSLFLISITRRDGMPFSDVFVRQSDDNLLLGVWKVRYSRPGSVDATWQERAILAPGVYLLKTAGSSEWWSTRDGSYRSSGQWSKDVQFSIDYPDHLRPYIKSTTIGDNRIMDPGDTSWNPSPYGLGLPIYSQLGGLVQAKVAYLGKIYDTVNVTVRKGTAGQISPLLSSISPNVFGEVADNPAAVKWKTDRHIPPAIASELSIVGQIEPGVNTLEITFDDPLTSGRTLKLDQWDFEASRFPSFPSHIDITGTSLSSAFDHFGPVAIPPLPDINAYPIPNPVGNASTDMEDWQLPLPVAALIRPLDNGGYDRFLKLASRLGCRIKQGAAHSLEGYFEPPSSAHVAAMLDPLGSGYVLWLRTVEPLDWRRVTGAVLYRPMAAAGSEPAKALNALTFDLQFTPSTDGTSAFLALEAAGRLVRLPRGILDVRLQYALVQPGLPSNRRVADGQDWSPMLGSFRIANPFGSNWPQKV